MPKNNFVFLKGIVTNAPYFGWVTKKSGTDGKNEKIAFLRFYLSVPRDNDQPDAFSNDKVRIVAYGSEAEKKYPVLQREGLPAVVIGWLQHRVFKRQSILEVVASTIQMMPQHVVGDDILTRLQDLSSQWGMSIEDVLKMLLLPQFRAVQNGQLEFEDLENELNGN